RADSAPAVPVARASGRHRAEFHDLAAAPRPDGDADDRHAHRHGRHVGPRVSRSGGRASPGLRGPLGSRELLHSPVGASEASPRRAKPDGIPVQLSAIISGSGPMTANQTTAGDEIPKGTEVIEVHVSELSQIFNSLDPAPFHEKDLDLDAEEFIVGWAKELPRDKALALRVHLDKPAVRPGTAEDLRQAGQSFFARPSPGARQ